MTVAEPVTAFPCMFRSVYDTNGFNDNCIRFWLGLGPS